METKNNKKPDSKKESKKEKGKSAFTLFREKYPTGVGEIIDRRAVLR
jgi:hypothetical protein